MERCPTIRAMVPLPNHGPPAYARPSHSGILRPVEAITRIPYNLRGTNLSRSLLTLAHLSGADLSEAHLIGTDLSGAHLLVAHLSGAHLSGANLSSAHLS